MNIVDFITLINQLLNRRISTKIRKLKQIFLLGDFSINLLNYNKGQPTSEFLNCLSCKSIIPYVLQPRSLISHSKTLIDNFFSNVPSCEAISRNITGTIPDHLPQFLLLPMWFQILYSINQIIWTKIGRNLTETVLFIIVWQKFIWNSLTRSKSYKPIHEIFFGSNQF